MSALTLGLLRELDDFLMKDLSAEKLTHKCKNKVKVLLGRITECIRYINEQEKLDRFLTQQRRESQMTTTAKETDKACEKAKSGHEFDDEDNFYMDLSSVRPDSYTSQTYEDEPDGAASGGSGSGYESYDSEGEIPNRPKTPKEEEDLNNYFTMPEYSVFSYVYTENKSMFKGKSWHKRIGVVKEKHFLCYKKPTDSAAATNFPLGAYNCSLKNADNFVLVTFSETGGHECYKFYIDREASFEWTKVLKDVTMSFKDEVSFAPPPVAARPASTLPTTQRGPPPPPLPANRFGPIQRSQSAGVSETAVSDQTPNKEQGSPPPNSPGNTLLNITGPQLNHIGKGLKTAVTDIFKKDKTKKRMMTAENLGADISGNLSVFDNKWTKKWCLIRNNELFIYGKDERPELQLQLRGCTLLPAVENPGTKCAFKILKDGKEVAFLEAHSSSEMGKWVEVLIAAMGIAPSADTKQLHQPITATVKPVEKESETTLESNDEDDYYMDLNTVYKDETKISKTRSSLPEPKSPDHNVTTVKAASKDNVREDNGEIKSVHKKDKSKRKEKKRTLTSSDITLPTEVTQMPEIVTVERTRVNLPIKHDNKNEVANEDTDGEKRAKELRLRKADIKTQLLTLSVKKDELRKYIEASSSEKERGRLKMSLQKAADEYTVLEKEDVKIRCKLRGLKHGSYDATSTDDKVTEAITAKVRPTIETGGTKSVLARAQMWEAGNKA